ncbi:unnamed protein product, partial [marine sediment metagenome]
MSFFSSATFNLVANIIVSKAKFSALLKDLNESLNLSQEMIDKVNSITFNYPKSIGLKEDYLYEVLATTFSINNNNIIPNTACMGIRLIDNSSIKLRPYPNTSTYKNLRSNKLITLNFVDDIFLYALASLKDFKRSKSIKIFPEEFYDYYKIKNKEIIKEVFKNHPSSEMVSLPYIKQAWAMLACVAM